MNTHLIQPMLFLLLSFATASPAVGQPTAEYLVGTVRVSGYCHQPLVLSDGGYVLIFLFSASAPSMEFSLTGANGSRGEVVQCATIDPAFADLLTNGLDDWLFVQCDGQIPCGSPESSFGLGTRDLAGRTLTRVCLSAIDDGARTADGTAWAWRDVKFLIYAVDPGRPPVPSWPPVGQSLPCHGTAYIDAFVEGTPPMHYRWMKDGVDVPDDPNHLGVATSRLVILQAALADTGWYTAEVSNAFGRIVMPIGRLQVNYVADFNASGSLTVQDIFEFLAAYLGGDLRADVNRSWDLTVEDVFDFLAAYFAGCL